MRFVTAFALLFAIATFSSGNDKKPVPITPARAAKKVGETVIVEMEVKSTGGKGHFFLNTEADHRGANNFTIYIPKEAVEAFKKAGIDNPAEHFKGKTIRVSGEVILYREKPEIKVDDPKQIQVVDTVEKLDKK